MEIDGKHFLFRQSSPIRLTRMDASRQQILHHLPKHIRQPEAAALIEII